MTAAIGKWGDAEVFDASNARAENTFDERKVVGAVAVIGVRSGSTWIPFCSGTLVARDKILTAPDCVIRATGSARPASDFRVRFERPADDWNVVTDDTFGVVDVRHYPLAPWTGGVASLTLDRDVPRETVGALPGIYTGDVPALLQRQRTQLTSPIVVGFGPDCPTCTNPPARRYGRIQSDLTSGASGHEIVIDSSSPPPPGTPADAVAHGIDVGGPLMIKHPDSGRWVVVGVSMYRDRWIHLGTTMSGAPYDDHWPFLQYVLDSVDEDGDRVPDDADNCQPSICRAMNRSLDECANPNQEEFQRGFRGDACCFADTRYVRNSNREVEDRLQATMRPDACDPLPIVHLEGIDPRYSVRLTHSVGYNAKAWLGSGVDERYALQDTAFRFCGCYDQFGGELAEAQCLQLSCDPSEVVDGGGGFVKLDVSAERMGVTRAITGDGFGQRWLWFSAGQESSLSVEWEFRRDAIAGIVPSATHPGQPSPYDRSITGFFASAVLDTGEVFSGRDTQSGGKLRADLDFLASHKGPITPADPPEDPFPGLFGHHPARLPSDEPWVYPGTNLGPLTHLVALDPKDDVPFAHLRGVDPVALRFGELIVDHTAWTYPSAAGPWLWIPAVEPTAYLREQQVDARAIYLAPSGASADHAALVLSGATGMQVVADDASADLQMVQAAAGEPLPVEDEFKNVRMPQQGAAVFSASRNALWLIGGSNLPPDQRLRRYDPTLRSTDIVQVPLGFAPQAEILGATYDAFSDLLYVLDTDGAKARLVEHDLANGTARTLWLAPFQRTYDSTYLGITENGRLVLGASDSSTTTVWLLDLRSGEVVFDRRLDLSGPPAALPAMGRYALSLPYIAADGLRYADLTPGLFEEGAPCTGL